MNTPTYITPQELARILREEPSSVAVVDVREADYTLGKVINSIHIPFCQFEGQLAHLQDLLNRRDPAPARIVFHCHYSQTRGPAAARLFLHSLREMPLSSPPQVLILEGGFKLFRNHFQDDPAVYQAL